MTILVTGSAGHLGEALMRTLLQAGHLPIGVDIKKSAFTRDDLQDLRTNAAVVVRRHVPRYEDVYFRRGWSMFPDIDRVYVNERARNELGWRPKYDFARFIDLVDAGEDPRSPLARTVGSKGYHAGAFADGPYPVE